MSTFEHDNDAGLAGFLAGWDTRYRDAEHMPVEFAVWVALTNFGEHPVQSTRLAEVLGSPVGEVEALARQWVFWPGIRVEDGLITFNPERAEPTARRQLRIGDRRFGIPCCAIDMLMYASLVRPSLQVAETCPATGTPIRVVFTPSGVESADPAGAVLPVPPPREFDRIGLERMTPAEVDASLCAQLPFYSSAEAAQGWLAAHPGGRVFPVREAWDLSFHQAWRDRMSALLNPAS